MKVLEKKENGLYNISYYDKFTKKNVVLNDVTEEVVKTLRKFKRQDNRYRKKQKKYVVSIDDYEDDNGEIIDDSLEFEKELVEEINMNECKELLNKSLPSLTTRRRQVINMLYLQDLSFKEVAETLGISESRVYKIHDETMEKLRKLMGF